MIPYKPPEPFAVLNVLQLDSVAFLNVRSLNQAPVFLQEALNGTSCSEAYV
jgi:hypothetical protein